MIATRTQLAFAIDGASSRVIRACVRVSSSTGVSGKRSGWIVRFNANPFQLSLFGADGRPPAKKSDKRERNAGGCVRLKTIGPKQLRVESNREMRARKLRANILDDYPEVVRPLSRGDCVDAPRPCPWVSCRHHLYLDVNHRGGIKINHPHLEVWEMAETCVLDLVDKYPDEVPLSVISESIGLSYDRTFNVIEEAMDSACSVAIDKGIRGT